MKPYLVLAAIALAACSPGDGRPAGNEESKTYAIEGFDSVSAETGIVLILKQGPFSISAQSQRGDLSRLHVDLRGSELNVSADSMLTMGIQPTYTVTLSAPKWTAIKANAGVDVTADTLTVESLDVEASTGVQMKLSGACREIDIDANTGASVDASGLKCAAATVKAMGGAHVGAFATEKLDAKAHAGAVIDISGNPPMVEKENDISGVINVN